MAESTSERNAYVVLGVHKGATQEEIKQAYVTQVKKYNPEVHTERFMVVQNAFDRLEDPEKRAKEDIQTFNFIRCELTFTDEDKKDVPDDKLAA